MGYTFSSRDGDDKQFTVIVERTWSNVNRTPADRISAFAAQRQNTTADGMVATGRRTAAQLRSRCGARCNQRLAPCPSGPSSVALATDCANRDREWRVRADADRASPSIVRAARECGPGHSGRFHRCVLSRSVAGQSACLRHEWRVDRRRLRAGRHRRRAVGHRTARQAERRRHQPAALPSRAGAGAQLSATGRATWRRTVSVRTRDRRRSACNRTSRLRGRLPACSHRSIRSRLVRARQ